MKAEKVLGIVACAVACAMSTNAFAGDEDWFSAAVDNGDLELSAVTTNGVPVEIDAVNGKIVLDNEFDSRLVFRPVTENPPKSDNFVKITSTALLTPSDVADLNSAAAELAEAKAGFAVGVDGSDTNFYGFANGAWTKLTGRNPADGENTTFTIAIDYRVPSVMFYVGGDVLYSNNTATTEFAIAAASNLASVDCYGSGSLTSLSTTYEIAVAAVVSNDGTTTNRYGTVAEAIAAAGDDQSKIAVVDPNTGATDAPAASAANGLAKWECEALNIAEDAAISLEPSTKQNANMITLALAVEPVDGVTVKFGVKAAGSESATGPYDADNIQIPMNATTKYTIVPTITAQ
jgi:hypothetical protein